MINLKKEHEAFNAEFKRIGREYSSDLNSVGFNGILSANELGWLACAESKQAEIDSLKAQLAKFESSEFVVVPVRELKVILSCVSPDDMNLYEGVYEASEVIEKAMIEAVQEQNND